VFVRRGRWLGDGRPPRLGGGRLHPRRGLGLSPGRGQVRCCTSAANSSLGPPGIV
jgi:hypothetical protein